MMRLMIFKNLANNTLTVYFYSKYIIIYLTNPAWLRVYLHMKPTLLSYFSGFSYLNNNQYVFLYTVLNIASFDDLY